MTTNDSIRTDAQLTGRLQDVAKSKKGRDTPALSFAVATTGGLYVRGASGAADLSTHRRATVEDQYPWFSMTKIATATATTRLAAEGTLDLDAPIDTYLPAYEGGPHGVPTVRQLLNHTAGLGNPLPMTWVRPSGRPADPSLTDTIIAKHGTPRRVPGGRGSYSNIGYLLAGRVLEAITGQSVEAVITRAVLAPLRMTATGFEYNCDRPAAVGYIRAPRLAHPVLKRVLPAGIVGDRVQGYTSLNQFLVEGPAYGGLIGPASDAVKLAVSHLTPTGPLGDVSDMRAITEPGKPFDHGIGWFRKPPDATRTPTFVEHYGTGGGFWNAMRIYPDLGVAMVGMANTTATWPYDDFFNAALQVLEQHQTQAN